MTGGGACGSRGSVAPLPRYPHLAHCVAGRISKGTGRGQRLSWRGRWGEAAWGRRPAVGVRQNV
eukprot:9495462-Pyramimonas_sp.AAC.1